MRNTSIVVGIILSVILFLIGYKLYPDFFMWSLPVVEDVHYIETSMTGVFLGPISFGLAIGLIPIVVVLIWRFANITSVKRRVLSALIIIVGIAVAGFVRYNMILSLAKRISENRKGRTELSVEDYIPASKVDIDRYMLAGLFISAVIVYFLFRVRKNEREKFDFEK